MNEKGCWEVGRLPFIIRALQEPSNGGVFPDALPFALTVDRMAGLIQQFPDQAVLGVLAKVYQEGSTITGMMEDRGIGRDYAEDFLSFIQGTSRFKTLERTRILEIGCGTGYLLSRLKALGADVVGVEPGSQGQSGAKRYNVPVIRDFFPSNAVVGKFDCVILYDVLEHVQQPRQLLDQIAEVLAERGKILIAVEDEESYLESGDVSILFHEHFSYFTEGTLSRILVQSGFGQSEIQRSDFSRLLYAAAAREDGRGHAVAERSRGEETVMLFRKRALGMVERFSSYLRDAANQNQTVGIYVPHRAVNALAMAGQNLDHIRFFDDNPVLHGTYFPGIPIPIETREDLIRNPPGRVFIPSRSFGERIARQLQGVIPSTTEVHTWKDMDEETRDERIC
jgi:SAM-dependent methyltransferase